MKILKIIGIALLAIIIIGAIAASMQPGDAHTEQSIVINASPATIYQELNGFKTFSKWSPWAKMDPNATYTFEGPESGVGAKMSWKSEKWNVGNGAQWVEESIENKKVKNGLTFEGQPGTSYATFVLEPMGDGTTVTWMYDGKNEGMMGKAMWMMMSGMMNDVYIQGLSDLKAYVESLPPAPADSTVVNP
ncbi:MAG: SRPBCC family protein [Cyclobacteriaceae bacterium]|nr:SRPBCC family protein [Cyclobacteriaceae bacterium]